MVMDGNQTYYGDRSAMYTNTKPWCCAPETHIMLHINYTSMKIVLNVQIKLSNKAKVLFLIKVFYVAIMSLIIHCVLV